VRVGPALVLFGPALGWALAVAIGATATAVSPAAWRPVDLHGSAYVGDDGCRDCHLGNWESWHRSYHRTMTQSVEDRGAEVVLAPFAGEQLSTAGFVATMDRDPHGQPRVRVHAEDRPDDPPLVDATVALAVGSHRYQQYVARIDRGGGEGELWRLPLAWHLGEARWIHMGSAFLEPDPTPGDAEAYLRHLSRYNDNCIFCHNTQPVPGLHDQGWRSEVAQWGIACEACHGPASAHVERHRSPLRRVLAVLGDDGSIVDPGSLPGARAAEICGRCHGQRIGHDIRAILRDGDGFVPGDALVDISRPIFADSRVGDDDTPIFAERFWPDGTPRLSAHEYQGLLLSPCYDEGRRLGCESCHDMHGAEPSMQLRADWDASETCVGCHPRERLGGGEAHGGHGEALTCSGCHLPRTSYGLLEGMISHRVGSPDPGAWLGRDDMPDACTQCHVDRSRAWAAEAMATLGLRGSVGGSAGAREGWGSRVLLDLHGGDPIQRALAAEALARPEVPADPTTRLSWLIDALADDYGAVRWIAWRAAKRLAGGSAVDPALVDGLATFDPGAPPESRLEQWRALRALAGPGPFVEHSARQLELEASRDASAIVIGE
jgi:predicted CXXCH cytochrome family protein